MRISRFLYQSSHPLWPMALVLLASLAPTANLTASDAEVPHLIVVVSADQWRYEYFERFRVELQDGISTKCRNSGVWFENCFHQHAFTYTGPGHAVLLTGTYAARNGIIDNVWYDRRTKTGRYCVGDNEATLIGTTKDDTKASPRPLLVDTAGDQLKLASQGKSKVFGIAIKDRAAILMTGHMADAAYWMSTDGKWITSNYYTDVLPGYLRQINELRSSFRFAGASWTCLYKSDRYVHGPSDTEESRPKYGMSAHFPHTMPTADDENYIKHVACSPFGNQLTLEAARALITHEQLGQDEHPDLLAINLSSTDYVGHTYGPYSLEVEDMTYQSDQALGDFASYLEQQLPGRTWVMIVTSDHGVAPIPEWAQKRRLSAGRDPFGEANEDTGNIELARIRLEVALRSGLAWQGDDSPLVEAVVKNQVFLSAQHPALTPATRPLARQLACDWLTRQDAVAYAVTREQLQQNNEQGEMMRLLERSFHPRRSGDVLYVLAPYYITGDAGTTHGSPWLYDRHVPLMMLSNHSLEATSIQDVVSPASIAPTIAQWLRIPLPSACTVPALDVKLTR